MFSRLIFHTNSAVPRIGGTWIHAAVDRGDQDVLDFAAKHHDNVNERGESRSDVLNVFKWPTHACACAIDNHGTTSLDYALKGGRLEMAGFMVARGAAFDASGGCMVEYPILHMSSSVSTLGHSKTSLHYAAEGGHIDAVKYVVSKTADFNRKGMSKTKISSAQAHSDFR
jgi:ankyrin repeat protein